jgi:hypothetical protein
MKSLSQYLSLYSLKYLGPVIGYKDERSWQEAKII